MKNPKNIEPTIIDVENPENQLQEDLNETFAENKSLNS